MILIQSEKLGKDFSTLLAVGVLLQLECQDHELLENKDCLVVSPGISIHHALIQMAYQKGIMVMSEIEVAYLLCEAPIFAVTGTNGKTTTTTLIGEMLKTTGRKVKLWAETLVWHYRKRLLRFPKMEWW